MKKILIIEDDNSIRQELKQLLENALYHVTILTEWNHIVRKYYGNPAGFDFA